MELVIVLSVLALVATLSGVSARRRAREDELARRRMRLAGIAERYRLVTTREQAPV